MSKDAHKNKQEQAARDGKDEKSPKKSELEEDSVKETCAKIRESIEKIIESIPQELSVFTRCSNWFGAKPIWLKILIGLAILIPTLVTGLVTHMIVFYVFCGISALLYLAISALMVDHCRSFKKHLDPLKAKACSVVDIFDEVTQSLDRLTKIFSEQADKFDKNNQNYAASNSKLAGEVSSLNSEVNRISGLEKQLRTTADTYSQATKTLTKEKEEILRKLNETETSLAQTTSNLTTEITRLNGDITHLEGLHEAAVLELTKAETIAKNLKAMMDVMTGSVIGDEKQREKFKETLNHMLIDTESNFASISQALEETTLKLEQTTIRYEELLKRQEEQIKRLEKLPNSQPQPNPPLKKSNSKQHFQFFPDGNEASNFIPNTLFTKGMGVN